MKRGLIVLLLCVMCVWAESPSVRVKDIASIAGVRSNQLMGVGLVVGLKGTGDSGSVFTDKALTNLLANFGASVQKDLYKSKNVAAVMVTAELPAFVKQGQKVDVMVSSIGDATSLKDGTLLMTPLKGPDDKVYLVAQGQVVTALTTNTRKKVNESLSKVIDGGIVEKEVSSELVDKNKLSVLLKRADFTTAERVASALERGGFSGAKALDAITIEVPLTPEDKEDLVPLISRIEDFLVVPDSIAKVVINQRTGTVVIGENVRLAPVAVSHGEIEIKIVSKNEQTDVMDELLASTTAPAPAAVETPPANESALDANGQPIATKSKENDNRGKLIQLKAGTSLSSLVKALNAVGATPQDMIAIIQALKAAGSLSADVEVI
jgi:flagellar P-ring protein FlgI